MSHPNILYIHSHDTGRYIQPFGHAMLTPNFQQLAEQGVLFRQAFCANPTCSPSRAALLTGQWPHSCGMLGLAHRGFRLNDYSHHLVHTLKKAGYTTALSGFQHVGRAPAADPSEIGYDEIFDTAKNQRATTDAAIEFLNRSHDKPFFLDVGYTVTHRSFPEPEPEDDPRYCIPPAPLPDTPETRYDTAAYKTCVRILDTEVGRVLNAIDRAGLSDNTIVISTTDHGIAFPMMKCNLTDHGIGVMLIMRGPGFSGGKVIDGMVSQIDLFPTLCDVIGIDHPHWLQGKSILPLVREETDEIHDEIFAEINYHSYYDPQRAIRTKKWKYIRHWYPTLRPGDINCDGSPSKSYFLDQGWRQKNQPSEQLYDLIFDPHETNNLASDPKYQDAIDDLRHRLQTWMETTDDPLLAGSVPAPEGARINDPADLQT